MLVKANANFLGKFTKSWTDDKGVEHKLPYANISQQNGESVDTIRLSLEQYNIVEANKQYVISAEYGMGKNGGYLRITDIAPAKATN